MNLPVTPGIPLAFWQFDGPTSGSPQGDVAEVTPRYALRISIREVRVLPEELRKPAQTLNEAFRQSMSIYRFTTGPNPLWYGLALSEFVLLVGDAEIIYSTARFDADSAKARFLVVTAELVIDMHVTAISQDQGDRDVRAVSRRKIRSLGVRAGETPFSSSAFSDWPGEITVKAGYDGLSEEVFFPLERGQGRAELELLAALRADLKGC